MNSIADPEFPHQIDLRAITAEPVRLSADAAQRAALAARFAIVAVNRLEAKVALHRKGPEVTAHGEISADIVQTCAVSGDDLAVSIIEPIDLIFVPESTLAASQDEEIELTAQELDQIAYSGTSFDLGEVVAQTLALAIDPYALGPNAELVRREHGLAGEEASGPLAAALRALKGHD